MWAFEKIKDIVQDKKVSQKVGLKKRQGAAWSPSFQYFLVPLR
jgi:hypothetical protein